MVPWILDLHIDSDLLQFQSKPVEPESQPDRGANKNPVYYRGGCGGCGLDALSKILGGWLV